MKSIASTASGESMTVHVHMRMPDEERDCGPDDEYIPWDFDNDTYGESDVADLLDEAEE